MARARGKTMAMTQGDHEGVEQGAVVQLRIGSDARSGALALAAGGDMPDPGDVTASGPLTGFADNRVVTSKYTKWTFLPKFLWEAYHHVSNVYFTFDLAIQLIPDVTPVPPVTTIVPLLFVLGTSGLREAVEDLARHKADEITNNATAHVLRGGKFKAVRTQDITVGDVIRVDNGQEFPADIILLSSSHEQGVCYDMTANLDGETNLKLHRTPPVTQHIQDAATAWALDATYKYELPNARIHQFNGSMLIDGRTHSLETQHCLLRGSQLRNTDWVMGVVAYTGADTKLSRNQQQPPSRMSVMEYRLNLYVLFMFGLQMVSCLTMTTMSVVWSDSNMDGAWYLGGFEFSSQFVLWWRNYGTWFILFALFIPISLFVTLEVVRFIQALFMRWDRLDSPELLESLGWGSSAQRREAAAAAAGEPASTQRATLLDYMTHVGGIKPRTSSLNEDLGAIEYVFSDKTGTLTVNKMRFAHAYAACDLQFDEAARPGQMAQAMASGGEEQAGCIRQFLRILAVCHTAVPERLGSSGELVYNTESTDELALVTAARNNGLQLTRRSLDSIVVEKVTPKNAGTAPPDGSTSAAGAGSGISAGVGAGARSRPSSFASNTGVVLQDAEGDGAAGASDGAAGAGGEDSFELLATLEFSSARRRMSTLVRTPEGRIFLYCKGADLVIFERMAAGQAALHSRFERVLDEWSGQGLRTLVMAARELSVEEYTSWKARLDTANASITNRAALVDQLADELEMNLVLVGATAIEDQLQDMVPDTIAYLRQAGVKVWVLTGDKRSTAISVAYSARLVTPSTRLIKVQVDSKRAATAAIRRGLEVCGGAAPAAFQQVGDEPSRLLAPHAPLAAVNEEVDGMQSNGSFDDDGNEASDVITGVGAGAGAGVGAASAAGGAPTKPASVGESQQDAHGARHKRLSQRQASSALDSEVDFAGGFCLVLDGRSLVHLLSRTHGNRAGFFALIEQCTSVIVCRATPLQKADVVAAVQGELGRVTLAIGDGANDVSMIQKAHVGVGVMGREGTQAARSADYAISQFKHLKRLMAVHGRYSYIRLALLIKYSFYKNLTFTLLPLWFGLRSGFTGQTLHDAWVITFYNMIYTAAPPLMHGLFEKDIPEDVIEATPQTYAYTQSRSPFQFKVYLAWLLNAIFHSLVIYYGCELALAGETLGSGADGRPLSFWGYSMVCSTVCVVVVLLKAALVTRHWTLPNHIVTWGSALLYIITMWIYTVSGFNQAVVGLWVDVILTPRVLLSIPLIAGCAILPDFAVEGYRRWYHPHDWEILLERTRGRGADRLPVQALIVKSGTSTLQRERTASA